MPIKCIGYDLKVRRTKGKVLFEILAQGDDGETHPIQINKARDRPELVRAAFNALARWPRFDFEFEVDASGVVTNIL